MRLLISCRDPAAAAQIAAIWPVADKDPRFSPILVAQQPACKILMDRGLPVQGIPTVTASAPNDPAADSLYSMARALLEEHQPDCLLCGLSGPEAGIDEALLAMRGNLPAFAIQDFWGDANSTLGRPADLYFVPDRLAAAMTRQLHGVASIASGQPRYLPYSSLDASVLAAGLRTRLGVDETHPVIAYFGQPLDHLPGYQGFADSVARAVHAVVPHATLVLRPHPKQDPGPLTACSVDWRGRGLDCRMIADGPAEALMATSLAVISAFSMSGQDALMLTRASGRLAGIPIYLNYGAPSEFFASYSGIRQMPSVSFGTALEACRSDMIPEMLRQALDMDFRQRLLSRIQSVIPPPGMAAVTKILDVIASGNAHVTHDR